jgi:hypothetical protein
MRKVRINVLMPVGLVEEINESVGARKRSSFFVEAAKEKLERIKLAEAMNEAVGSWSEELHPELKTQDDIDKWVRSLRLNELKSMSPEEIIS